MIEREAFFGGERYFCAICNKVVEENHYPPTENSTTAEKIWENDPDRAQMMGIYFSGIDHHECDYIQDEIDEIEDYLNPEEDITELVFE